MSKIYKIVITGGPCAGKSSSLDIIKKHYENRDIKVVTLFETATDLINQGIAPWNCKTPLEFQRIRIKKQIEREKEIYEYVKTLNNDKIIILFDRGLLDSLAYTEKKDFENILKENNLNIISARDEYDAVFHMMSVSKGHSDFYTLDNNQARIESVSEAKLLDDKIISSWVGHPHFRIIPSFNTFEEKVDNLIKEIDLIINDNQLEIERKYLIELDNIDLLINNKYCEKVNITQTYLNIDENQEIRVRKRGIRNNFIYYHTVKKYISDLKREEIENKITEEEYYKLLNSYSNVTQIKKDRYCLVYKNQYLEIDIYPFWNNQAILEVELSAENKNVCIPDYIKIIKEVTNEKEFKNSFLAKKYGDLI